MEFILRLRIWIVRLLLQYNDIRERKQRPSPQAPTVSEKIPSNSSRGFAELHFYTRFSDKSRKDGNVRKHPVVIDFHGGGFSSGVPSMDARWASTLLDSPLQPVVVGVNYSLLPEYPFPSALQDATAAITWLAGEGASKYGLDSSRIVLSGFSAGGSLVLTTLLWMHDQALLSELPHPIRGVVSVYPKVDYRQPREVAEGWLSRFLNDTWTDAYPAGLPTTSPFISIAASEDSVLQEALPSRIGLYFVAKDSLESSEMFRRRLCSLGKHVTGDVEADAVHAWDKYPITPGDGDGWTKRDAWFGRMRVDVEQMLRLQD